jgi:O-antigen/teichoic acid export membrane protein
MSSSGSSRDGPPDQLPDPVKVRGKAETVHPRVAIRSNVKWLAAANFGVKPVWFLFLLASTRILGAGQFGSYMFALSLVSVIAIFMEGGIDIHLVRELSPEGERFPDLFSHTLLLKVTSAVLVMAVAAGASLFISLPPGMLLLLLLAGGFSGSNAVMLHCRAAFRSFEVMKYEAFSIMVEKGVVMVFCMAALLVVNSAVSFMAGYALAYGIACGFTLFLVFTRIGRPRFAFSARYLWEKVIRPALPFALMNIFTVIYFRSGTLLISLLTGSDQLVGYYNAGYRLVESYMLFPAIIAGPIYPVLVRRIAVAEDAGDILLQAVRAVLPLSVVFAVPLFLFRADFTRVLFGDGYAPAHDAVGIVALSMIPVGMNFIFGTVVAASGRQRTGNKFIALVTALNIIMNLVLIPMYGVAGAATATVLTESMLAVSYFWIVRDQVRLGATASLLWRIAAPVMLAAFVFMLGPAGGIFFLKLGVFLAVVGTAFLMLGVISISDLKKLVRAQ